MARTLISTIIFISLLILFPLMLENSWATSQAMDTHFQPNNDSSININYPEEPNQQSDELGKKLPLWAILPFIGILLSIAIFPLMAPIFWHHHFPKVSAFWSLIFALPFVYFYHGDAIHKILHIYLVDYFPFIIMLWALFTIAGGIVVRGNLQGRPTENTILLFVGALIASWVGTTGASMIMIRPVLRANASRKKKAHIFCFFIFLIANIGGSLTPLGDPPLFLGFLHGVPFFWTFNILPHMLFSCGLLLVIFFLLDSFYYRSESHREVIPHNKEKIPLHIEGWHNLFFLTGVVCSIFLSCILKLGEINIFSIVVSKQDLLRDVMMVVMGILSLLTTKKALRKANEFTWAPIKEVAYLFAGIFMTIIPAIAILKAGSEGAFAFLLNAVKEPFHYYWLSGGVSSFLDNAPTYLTFFNSALGKLQIPEQMVRQALGYFPGIQANPEFVSYLKAISAGSVFMGANTYIGNACKKLKTSALENCRFSPFPNSYRSKSEIFSRTRF